MKKEEPAKTYTLDDFIACKSTDDLTYYNLSIIEVVEGVEHTDHNLVESYLSELLQLCLTVELTTAEYKKYKYHPDLLAYDIYGSTQLDFCILLANDCIDPKEFIKKKLFLPRNSDLYTFLNMVYSKETKYIRNNRSSYNT